MCSSASRPSPRTGSPVSPGGTSGTRSTRAQCAPAPPRPATVQAAVSAGTQKGAASSRTGAQARGTKPPGTMTLRRWQRRLDSVGRWRRVGLPDLPLLNRRARRPAAVARATPTWGPVRVRLGGARAERRICAPSTYFPACAAGFSEDRVSATPLALCRERRRATGAIDFRRRGRRISSRAMLIVDAGRGERLGGCADTKPSVRGKMKNPAMRAGACCASNCSVKLASASGAESCEGNAE